MKKVTSVISLVMVLIMMLSVVTVQAQTSYITQNNRNKDKFDDVDANHYAAQYIELMSDLGIINGYGNGNFGPNDNVGRDQFAKMMVLTLGLDLVKPSTGFFQDVPKSDWSFSYIETARKYLTGYRSNSLDYFRPTENAVREDMAVAIVKGLGLSVEGVDLSVLDNFSDKGLISANLKPYVAKAIIEKIMVGSDGKFNPLGTLKRAEAATLLARLITEEKVVYDDTKVVYDGSSLNATSKTTKLVGTVSSNKILLDWTEVNKEGFKYYKVVASKTDSTPSYSRNGYVQAISDVTDSDTYIYPNDKVNNGDTAKLIPGTKYYIAITSVYDNDEKYTSNVIEVTIPQEAANVSTERTPVLTATVVGSEIRLSWTKTNASEFTFYKVVLSKTDSTPVYPANGYVYYTNKVDENSYIIRKDAPYNNGSADDVGEKVLQGTDYYISITAVYGGNQYYSSNVIRLGVPATN